ncbi:MAG: flagellar assembly protein FliW [Thermodesulfobacteriota bacterium]|nr:flagellar assembly protein FliW [Thermodesulfobacteriota bacterium]
MKIPTSRFGQVEIDPQAIISMPRGLIGFPEQKRYIILRHNPESPFFWFQAVDAPDLAFVIVDPLIFKPDYDVPLPKPLLADLKAVKPEDLGIYVIVTIPTGHPEKMTANLLGPLLINTASRLARQLVLDKSRYSHRFAILAGQGPDEDQTEEKHPENQT